MGSSVSLEQFPLQSQMHRPIVMTSNAFISSSIEALRVKLTMSSAFSGIRNVKDLQGNLKFLHISTGRSRNLGRVYDIADARGQVIYSVEPAEMTTFKKDFVHGDIDLATSHGYISQLRMTSQYFHGMTLCMASFNYGQFQVLFTGDPQAGGVPIAQFVNIRNFTNHEYQARVAPGVDIAMVCGLLCECLIRASQQKSGHINSW